MMIIKTSLLGITLLFVFYRIGLLINKSLKSHNYFHIILYGFITTVAMLQIIYIPMILWHTSFNAVLYATITLVTVAVLLSFFLCRWKEEKKLFQNTITKINAMKRKHLIIAIVLLFVILLQAGISSLLFNENADDAFYVSLVEENQHATSIYTVAPSLGIENTTFLSRYMISGHELALAVVAKIFSIPTTILCHTILPFMMILFSYMAYYLFARGFFHNKKSQLFLLLLAILFLFSGFTTRLRGIILLGRMWQGKEIFLNIVLTLILSNLINLNVYNKKKKLIALTILNISAIFFTNTAIFLVFFAYLPFGIITVLKREWKKLIALIFTGLPIAFYGILYLIIAKNVQGSTFIPIQLNQTLKDYIGTGYYHILYGFSLVIIAFKGTPKAKRYFLVVPILYAATIYNPLLTKVITQYFTGSEVFWRLFWLLPVEFSIVYSFILLLELKNPPKYKLFVFLIEILLLILTGEFVYTKKNGFEIAENLNKVPQSIISETQYILEQSYQRQEKATVMAPPEPLHSVVMRQLTSDIHLFWSRDHYMKEIYPQETIEEMEKIRVIYKNQVPQMNPEDFNQIRQKYHVNWIIINAKQDTIIQYLNQTNAIDKIKIENDILYQY